MVDHLDQTERVDRELNVVKRARFNQTIEIDKLKEVPETKFGVEPHTVKELPALPVRERQQDNMLLHQQLQDNMVDEEVVSFERGISRTRSLLQKQKPLPRPGWNHSIASLSLGAFWRTRSLQRGLFQHQVFATNALRNAPSAETLFSVRLPLLVLQETPAAWLQESRLQHPHVQEP